MAVVVDELAFVRIVPLEERQGLPYLCLAEEEGIHQLAGVLAADSVKDVQELRLRLLRRIVAQTRLEGLRPNISPLQVLAQARPPRMIKQLVGVRPLVNRLPEAQVHEVLACLADLHAWVELVDPVCHSVGEPDQPK